MAQRTEGGLATWEHPKKSGIRIREILNTHQGEAFGGSFQVTIPAKITGKLRERRQFKDRPGAEECAEKAFAGYRKQGQDFFALSEQDRREVAASLPLLKAKGISLGEAIRYAAKHLRPESRTKSLKEVVDEIIASKSMRFERGDLRPRSFEDFDQRARKIAGAFDGRIAAEITGEEVKGWLVSLKKGPRTNQNYLSVLSEIFKLATQRKYLGVSPIDSLTDIDRKDLCGGTKTGREPSILTPSQAEKIVLTAQTHPELALLGAVTLALFCGLRTAELERLEWDSVRLTEVQPVVTVGAKIAKKRRIRHVEIPANAVQWLSLVHDRKGLVVAKVGPASDYQQRFKKLIKFASFTKWENNAMRHSFGSYHYALNGNPLETSRLLGHKASDQVLFDHYRALATKAQAKSYFGISPRANSDKIVDFA